MSEQHDEAVGLDQIKPGERATIVRLELDAIDGVERRLMALGFMPGTAVEVRCRAPLGDPTEYALRGTRVSLRKREAAHVRVRTT